MTVSPMMRQYEEAKQVCGDALLLFRMGDFYELFHEDAKTCARVLGLTLTSRDKGENPIPMAGFPYHQLEGYLAKLIRSGHRVAVCDQVEDPKEAKGIVRREVTRIVTAGTLTDEALLDPLHTNLLVAVFSLKPGRNATSSEETQVGMAWAELSTGRFEAGLFPASKMLDELARLEPSEVLIREDDTVLSTDADYPWTVTLRPTWQFGSEEASRQLCQHFGTQNLEGMGWDEQSDGLAVGAAGAVLAYLLETQKTSLGHVQQLHPYRQGQTLEIDAATRRSLELTHTMRDRERSGSLLAVLDQTCTSMGARRLASWLAAPLLNLNTIQERHGAVEELHSDSRLRSELRALLLDIYDLERLLGRVATGRASPRDLRQVGTTLEQLPAIKQVLASRRSERLQQLQEELLLCEALRDELLAAFNESCPLHLRDGGFIREGYHAQLDELRRLASGGKQWIAEYQARQTELTGITSLKVGYTKVFGYYLEVTNAHKDKVPDHFVRKQTLKNAERYITDELKKYEIKVISADEQALGLELELFQELRNRVSTHLSELQQVATVLSELDVLAGLAELAQRQDYIRPEMLDSDELEIIEGRHPVLDVTTPKGTFVPNDCQVGASHGSIVLITGPNMAGKSTYIRQVALLTLMAQLGSFVPAKRARIGVADRIFARVGASDELSRGQSTFMVEMVETARILNTASNRSLVILDEIGRGTSTYDGLSLAWAIVEHLHDHVCARTFFATHYHELTQLDKSLPGVRNFNVAVKEWDENIVFLHRIVPGGADKSYGIHVARLAGIPREVNERAKDILTQLESDHLDKRGDSKISPPKRKPGAPIQLTLFEVGDHPLLEKLRGLDLQSTTPFEALQLLAGWQSELQTEELSAHKKTPRS
ncbi:DNA mismatch repair protein MutS [Aureliella helgolandensis]|uniref:DNA mismatch repair protein MutS n=1 Tax=Aureliella helgolandensis TaxID=2527968 RepID=A0A518GGK0_9BACT|nr:DNA mismatch repair protein MutS [Aureliella helgolandensis]QDV27678.1 DNA mismatch repair protein MutS [Aureliella helgolandensis]